jgi:hypothetical protein
MAQKTTVVLVDDLDGGEAEQTVEFGLDGVTYEVDLSDKNAAALRELLADYVSHARRQGRSSRRSSAPTRPAARGTTARAAGSTTVDREQNKAIRDWARQHGFQVSDRGRIPSEVSQAYHQAS